MVFVSFGRVMKQYMKEENETVTNCNQLKKLAQVCPC